MMKFLCRLLDEPDYSVKKLLRDLCFAVFIAVVLASVTAFFIILAPVNAL